VPSRSATTTASSGPTRSTIGMRSTSAGVTSSSAC